MSLIDKAKQAAQTALDKTKEHYLSPAPRETFSITLSRLKLPTFRLGGNSLKVASARTESA